MTAMSAASEATRFAAADPGAAGRRGRGQLQERLPAARQDGDAGDDRGDPGQFHAGRSQRRPVGARTRRGPPGRRGQRPPRRRRRPDADGQQRWPHRRPLGALDHAARRSTPCGPRSASCCSAIPAFKALSPRGAARARRQHGQGARLHRRSQRRRDRDRARGAAPPAAPARRAGRRSGRGDQVEARPQPPADGGQGLRGRRGARGRRAVRRAGARRSTSRNSSAG